MYGIQTMSSKIIYPSTFENLSDEMGNKIQPELVENEFIILKADQSLKKTHLGRVEGMLMCKRAAEILGLKFKMKANGNKIC